MTKKRKQSAEPHQTHHLARFAVGSEVRVKHGTADPDFPDIPLGGWAGEVRMVDPRSHPPKYLIAWNSYTLEHMPAIYLKRCERDGVDYDSMWLNEEGLEPDTGEPTILEEPADVQPRPLNEADRDDRIRAILGLTSDDPLPDVDEDTLAKFHAYLVEHLSFPFAASFSEESGTLDQATHQVTVVGILDPDEADDMHGLLCEACQGIHHLEVPLAEVEAKKGDPNRRLIEDYAHWIWHGR